MIFGEISNKLPNGLFKTNVYAAFLDAHAAVQFGN